VVIVIGGAHSNNTHELVKTCSPFLRARASRPDGADLRDGMVLRGRHRRNHGRNFDAGFVNNEEFSRAICR
jgi:hypothetical protein